MEPGGGLDPHRQTHGVSQPGKFDEEGPQNRIVACIRLYSIKVIIIVILTQLVCQFNTFANVNDFQ